MKVRCVSCFKVVRFEPPAPLRCPSCGADFQPALERVDSLMAVDRINRGEPSKGHLAVWDKSATAACNH